MDVGMVYRDLVRNDSSQSFFLVHSIQLIVVISTNAYAEVTSSTIAFSAISWTLNLLCSCMRTSLPVHVRIETNYYPSGSSHRIQDPQSSQDSERIFLCCQHTLERRPHRNYWVRSVNNFTICIRSKYLKLSFSWRIFHGQSRSVDLDRGWVSRPVHLYRPGSSYFSWSSSGHWRQHNVDASSSGV